MKEIVIPIKIVINLDVLVSGKKVDENVIAVINSFQDDSFTIGTDPKIDSVIIPAESFKNPDGSSKLDLSIPPWPHKEKRTKYNQIHSVKKKKFTNTKERPKFNSDTSWESKQKNSQLENTLNSVEYQECYNEKCRIRPKFVKNTGFEYKDGKVFCHRDCYKEWLTASVEISI